jgi:hypothetical protein
LTLQFSEDVSAGLGLSDLILKDLTTGTNIATGSMTLLYSAATNRATLTFPGLTGQKLPDGRYGLSVLRAGVTDANGKQMAADFSFNFHVLTGDANGDAVVNDSDLYLVWQNLLKPAGARNLNEDLSGDGQVTIADVNVVTSRYLGTLPPLSAPSPLPALLSVLGAGNSSANPGLTITVALSRSIATVPQKAYQDTAAAPVASDLQIEVGSAAAIPGAIGTEVQRGAGSAKLAETNLIVRASNPALTAAPAFRARPSLGVADGWSGERPVPASLWWSPSGNSRSTDLLGSASLPLPAADDLSNEERWQTRPRSKLTKFPAVLSLPSNYRQHPKGSL